MTSTPTGSHRPAHRAPSAPALGRRAVLALAGAGAGALVLPSPAQAAPTRRAASSDLVAAAQDRLASSAAGRTSPRATFAGHKPGLTYLGISSPDKIEAREAVVGRLGAQRSFYQWTQGTNEDRTIRDDHAAGRLPWISFKPPGGSAAGWSQIASGAYDGDIRMRARRYAALSKPVVVTFHHEPTNDSQDGAAWSAAFIRLHDVMKAETGLKNVAFSPIIGEWAFNPRNKESAGTAGFLVPAVLDRMAFLGIDCYQNASGEGYDVRLGRVLSWLGKAGRPQAMIGIGETGATDTFGNVGATAWWERQWAWVAANSARVPVVSYFDSPLNSKATVRWPLEESPAKLAAFKRSLTSRTSCRLG